MKRLFSIVVLTIGIFLLGLPIISAQAVQIDTYYWDSSGEDLTSEDAWWVQVMETFQTTSEIPSRYDLTPGIDDNRFRYDVTFGLSSPVFFTSFHVNALIPDLSLITAYSEPEGWDFKINENGYGFEWNCNFTAECYPLSNTNPIMSFT